ncbi:MAG TPA: hypothetical protein DDW52_30330, partial [Planctomycetaceae bacterium]|nr:hypothetical protein [Planctomycetaceae bacterium]
RSQSLHLQFAVIRAYLGGVRRSALPTAFDRTEAAIDTILAHIGPRAAALSGRHAERAVELHDAGVAIGEIAARLGIKPRGVEFYLKECIDECKNES